MLKTYKYHRCSLYAYVQEKPFKEKTFPLKSILWSMFTVRSLHLENISIFDLQLVRRKTTIRIEQELCNVSNRTTFLLNFFVNVSRVYSHFLTMLYV